MQSRDCTGPAQFVNLHVNKCKTFQVYRSFNREEGFFFKNVLWCINIVKAMILWNSSDSLKQENTKYVYMYLENC